MQPEQLKKAIATHVTAYLQGVQGLAKTIRDMPLVDPRQGPAQPPRMFAIALPPRWLLLTLIMWLA